MAEWSKAADSNFIFILKEIHHLLGSPAQVRILLLSEIYLFGFPAARLGREDGSFLHAIMSRALLAFTKLLECKIRTPDI